MKRAALVLALVGLGACASVLGFRTAAQLPFEHRAHVLEGINCLECHTTLETAGKDDPVVFPTNESCWSCHEEPHDKRACDQCHGNPGTRFRAAEARKRLAFEHEAHLEVVKGNCVRCHVGVADKEAELRAPMAACLGCHTHDSKFNRRSCDGCHVDLPADVARPKSHAPHGEDFVDRHGGSASSARDLCASCHSEKMCATCHGVNTPALPQRLVFERPGLSGLHRAGFMSRHALEAAVDPGLCVTCHTEQSCVRCHTARGVSGARGIVGSPHPIGWVGLRGSQNQHGPAARRDPLSCASCHGGAGEMLCVECHKVGGVGGDPHPPGYADTRNQQTDRPCRLCHRMGPR